MKRIALFVLTNLAIMVVLMVFLNIIGAVFGINFAGMGGRQLDFVALGVFSLVVGFTGAFISLLLSKPMAKWSTGAHVIDQPRNAMESWLVDTVHRIAQKAGIGMPEVAIYEGEPNAFATGASRNSALVAVSTGLLQSMSKEEVEAVLGHEVAHVANGDMVTMTLIQGVMNTFVVFLSRVIGWVIDRMILKNENDAPGMGYWVSVIVLDIALGFLAAIIVAWFSRQREFRADAGSADYLGSGRPMINALARLGGMEPGELPQQVKAMGINGRPSGVLALFSSHPPIEDRIAALQARGR
jgi:heat shock protein HtpX